LLRSIVDKQRLALTSITTLLDTIPVISQTTASSVQLKSLNKAPLEGNGSPLPRVNAAQAFKLSTRRARLEATLFNLTADDTKHTTCFAQLGQVYPN